MGGWLMGLILKHEPMNIELIDFPLLKDKGVGDSKLTLQPAANIHKQISQQASWTILNFAHEIILNDE